MEPAALNGMDLSGMNTEEITDALWAPILQKYETKETLIPTEILRRVERDIMLQIVDAQWKDHLYSLDHLKEGIGLRGYGQRDPLVEYKKESFALFQAMKDRVEEEIVRYLWRLTPVTGEDAAGTAAPIRPTQPRRPPQQMTLSSPQTAPPPSPFGAIRGNAGSPAAPKPARTGGDDVVKQVKRDEPKVGRNDPCPCGSGKKYKKCHGA
jgi:preprotein translocase subunit SecA